MSHSARPSRMSVLPVFGFRLLPGALFCTRLISSEGPLCIGFGQFMVRHQVRAPASRERGRCQARTSISISTSVCISSVGFFGYLGSCGSTTCRRSSGNLSRDGILQARTTPR
jgi:hypothetical protein